MTVAATDFTQIAALRHRANLDQNDPELLREVAGQFEALFIQTLLKNMRAAELGESMLGNSDQHKLYQEMMDQQLSLEMASGGGIGLADMLVRQLGGEVQSFAPTAESFLRPIALIDRSVAPRELPLTPTDRRSAPRELPLTPTDRRVAPIEFPIAGSGDPPAAAADERVSSKSPRWSSPESFVKDVWPHAERVAKRLNVAPEGIVAQAALETGWGAHVMQRNNGASSNNLFGIKANNGWSGSSVSHPTVEYIDGVAEYRYERFRAYPDIGTTFDDYARFIEENPRYKAVLAAGHDTRTFAIALQESGYATDPLYAAKIARVSESDTMREAMNGLGVH
jgi:flagellar protein FlgJ